MMEKRGRGVRTPLGQLAGSQGWAHLALGQEWLLKEYGFTHIIAKNR